MKKLESQLLELDIIALSQVHTALSKEVDRGCVSNVAHRTTGSAPQICTRKCNNWCCKARMAKNRRLDFLVQRRRKIIDW